MAPRLLLSAVVRTCRNVVLLLAVALSLGAAQGFAAQQKQAGERRRPAATSTKAPVKRLYSKTASPLPGGAIVRISGYRHVSEPAYRDLRNASIALMKAHPPNKSVYIGLGRDPAPFIAFMQEIGADALNFPASGGYFSASAEMDRHFEKLIPKRYREGKKDLVLIDQTRSGKTHAAMMPLLRDYLRRTGSKVSVKAVAYNQGRSISHTGLGIRVIDTTPFPEVYKFFYSPYEGVVSPFNRHVPGQNTVEQLTMRPQYDQFRAGLRKRIQRDAVLDRYLANFVGRKPVARTRGKAWNLRRPYKDGLSDLGRGPIVTLGGAGGHGAINAAEYDEISWGAQQLLERHAPDQGRFYLGAGRSSSAIVAFLENLGTGVGYLPTDGLKAGRMSPEWSKTFSSYVAAAVPKEVLKRGETITVFQHGNAANAAALKQVVERHVRAAKSKSRVEVVTFAGASDGNQTDGHSTIVTRGRSMLQRLNGAAFAPIAQYAYHPAEALPASDYPKLKTAIQDRMQRDKALDAFLQQPEF